MNSSIKATPPKGWWLDADEIEGRIERELERATLAPSASAPAVNIVRFVEKHLGARLDEYADLDAGVLGQTEFLRGAAPHVRISRQLTASALDASTPPAGATGRWRATVAHEAAHIIFHGKLFVESDTLPLFAMEAPAQPVLHRCAEASVVFRGGPSDWREVQANMGMAALLMPRTFFARVVRAEFSQRIGLELPTSAQVEPLLTNLTERFEVSKQALRIRLETLGLVGDGRQTLL